jgi:hypothetical protein
MGHRSIIGLEWLGLPEPAVITRSTRIYEIHETYI